MILFRSHGTCAFCCAAPVLWNNIPHSVNTAKTVDNFKVKLKTHCYSVSFALWYVTAFQSRYKLADPAPWADLGWISLRIINPHYYYYNNTRCEVVTKTLFDSYPKNVTPRVLVTNKHKKTGGAWNELKSKIFSPLLRVHIYAIRSIRTVLRLAQVSACHNWELIISVVVFFYKKTQHGNKHPVCMKCYPAFSDDTGTTIIKSVEQRGK